jgi:hypothetical protein
MGPASLSPVQVPVIYTAAGTTSAAGNGYVGVGFSGGGDTSLAAGSGGGTEEPSSFSESVSGNVYANSLDFFGLTLLGASGGEYEGSGSWSATIDPTVEIDPTFLAGNPGYSLEIDPNPPATSPVPEPSISLLLGTGLIGLAAAVRRGICR